MTAPALALLQITTSEWVPPVLNLGLAGIMFYFYRVDRRDSEIRLEKVTVDFRNIVVESTKALERMASSVEVSNANVAELREALYGILRDHEEAMRSRSASAGGD